MEAETKNAFSIGEKSGKRLDYSHLTGCDIFVDDGDKKKARKLFSAGNAYCSVKDHFSKNIGRKVSLNKAVKDAFPNKKDRVAFWEAYDIIIGF